MQRGGGGRDINCFVRSMNFDGAKLVRAVSILYSTSKVMESSDFCASRIMAGGRFVLKGGALFPPLFWL